jgi:peroxiredoxin
MALENDTQAPDFELVNQFGERIQLSQFRERSRWRWSSSLGLLRNLQR